MKKLILILIFTFLPFTFRADKVFATDAQLACSPTTSTISVGQTLTSDIILNTRNFNVSGATVVMTYPPSLLDVTSASLDAETTDTGWTAPTVKTVDNNLGKITLDYGSSQEAFSDTATIGKVTFTGKSPGIANVGFIFYQEYDDTTAGISKVYGQKTAGTTSNILTDVVNCQYTVTGTTTLAPTSPPDGTTVDPTILPRTGGQDMMIVIAGMGGLVFALGLLGMKFAFL